MIFSFYRTACFFFPKHKRLNNCTARKQHMIKDIRIVRLEQSRGNAVLWENCSFAEVKPVIGVLIKLRNHGHNI